MQDLVANVEDHRQDAKWLVKALDELIPTTAEPQAQQEQKRLDEVLKVGYKQLTHVKIIRVG